MELYFDFREALLKFAETLRSFFFDDLDKYRNWMIAVLIVLGIVTGTLQHLNPQQCLDPAEGGHRGKFLVKQCPADETYVVSKHMLHPVWHKDLIAKSSFKLVPGIIGCQIALILLSKLISVVFQPFNFYKQIQTAINIRNCANTEEEAIHAIAHDIPKDNLETYTQIRHIVDRICAISLTIIQIVFIVVVFGEGEYPGDIMAAVLPDATSKAFPLHTVCNMTYQTLANKQSVAVFCAWKINRLLHVVMIFDMFCLIFLLGATLMPLVLMYIYSKGNKYPAYVTALGPAAPLLYDEMVDQLGAVTTNMVFKVAYNKKNA